MAAIRTALAAFATTAAISLAGCLWPEDRCDDVVDGFSIHPTVGGVTETSTRATYQCLPSNFSIDDYLFKIGFPDGSTANFAPDEAELDERDGGSIEFWLFVGNNTTLSKTPRSDDGTFASWKVRFDHWATFNEERRVERPGVAIRWDGPDNGTEDDAMPEGEYVTELAQRSGKWRLVSECTFNHDWDPIEARNTDEPNCIPRTSRFPAPWDPNE